VPRLPSLLSPQGRTGPTGFWLGFAGLSALSVAVLIVPKIGALLWLASLIPWAFLYARRLHDLGHSAWLQLIAWAVNLGLLIVAGFLIGWALVTGFAGPQGTMLALTSASGTIGGVTLTAGIGVFNLVWLVWLGTSSGDRDANRFGPAPKSEDEKRLMRAR
jgi:uncharacterized membrane protein YhaH (DUF805 family)